GQTHPCAQSPPPLRARDLPRLIQQVPRSRAATRLYRRRTRTHRTHAHPPALLHPPRARPHAARHGPAHRLRTVPSHDLTAPQPSAQEVGDADGCAGEAPAEIGSFSQFLPPWLRLGYTVAEPELIERMRTHRRYSIRHVPGHTQRAMALLIDSGQFHRTISRRRNHLRRKWETLTAALAKHLPWTVPFPAGGVSVWIEAPAGVNGRALAEECLRRGVVTEPGDPFFLSPEDNLNFFRLGFATIDLEDIEPGVRLLREAIDELG